MLKLIIERDENDMILRSINLPTHISEITPNWFDKMARNVVPADNYSLIALVSFEKLSTLRNNIKRKEGLTSGVLPLFIKSSDIATPFVKSIPMLTPIISISSVLSRAIHVNIKENNLSLTRIYNTIEGNTEIAKNIFTEYSAPVGIVEFKLIPNCDIYGIYPKIDDNSETNTNNPTA